MTQVIYQSRTGAHIATIDGQRDDIKDLLIDAWRTGTPWQVHAWRYRIRALKITRNAAATETVIVATVEGLGPASVDDE